jgi:ATP-dependent Lon protease
VAFSGYTENDKLAIARQYLLPRQRSQAGLSPEQLSVDDDAISVVIAKHTREAGVRQLERELGKVARKVARRIAADEVESVAVSEDEVSEILGRPTVHPERAAEKDQLGIATGLYYTPAGGDIMFVEVSAMPGKDQLVLTGQLGDVMKESARAALSYAKSHAADFDIPEKEFKGKDIHVHVPAGAVPKDGPSAGVAMTAALVSRFSGTPVRHEVAMTGEVTLSGRVLPIGGVKEKVLGAIRAGITTIILPKENVRDLEDLSEEDRDRITVLPVETLREVLSHALRAS